MTVTRHHCIFIFASFVTLGEVSAFDGWTAYCEEHEFENPPDAAVMSLAVWTQCKGIPSPVGFIDWIPSATNSRVCTDAGGEVIEHTCASVGKIVEDASHSDVQALSASSFRDRCCIDSLSSLWSWTKNGCGGAEVDADQFDAGKQAWTECDGVDGLPSTFSRTVISETNTAVCVNAGGVATVYTCDDIEQLIRWNVAYSGFSVDFQNACCPWIAAQEAENSADDAEGWYAPTSTKAPEEEVMNDSTRAAVASNNGMNLIPSSTASVVLFALTMFT